MTDAVRAYIDTLSKDPLRDDLRVTPGGAVVGRFLGSEVASAFQPVMDLATGSITGAQALARVHADTGGELSPWNLFSLAASDEQLVLLDRRCRIVHTLNFFSQEAQTSGPALLLNVHPRLLPAVASDHGRAFRRVLDSLAIEPRRVVILLPTLTRAQLDLQCQVAASYRIHGFRVAVTADEPALLQALLARQPVDVLRVDAHRLPSGRVAWTDAFRTAAAWQAERHIVKIETETQRSDALSVGASHGQGWLFATATASLDPQVRRTRHAAVA